MNGSRAEWVFPSNDSGIGPVTDEGVLEFTAAVENPTLQAVLCQPEVTSVKTSRLPELGILSRIRPEYPIRMETKDCENQDQKATSQPPDPAVCFSRTKALWITLRFAAEWRPRISMPPGRPRKDEHQKYPCRYEYNSEDNRGPH